MDAVTYHYVRPETDAPPSGYYYLPLEQFRRQLDAFADRLVSKSTVFACLRGDRRPPEDGVVLTFDDGLRDHYEWVKPELEKRDHWGIFFVPTAPLTSGRRLAVQRIHTLVTISPGNELLAALRDVLGNHGELSVPEGSDAGMYAERDTPDSVQVFKRILNEEVPYEFLPGVLDELERRFPDAGAVDAEDVYISARQLEELAASGMVIGAHSVSHRLLSRFPPEKQAEEIRRSRDRLSEVMDEDTDLFAYPYGTQGSYTARTKHLVAEAGFEYAFTTVSGAITGSAVAESPLALPRRDCTEFEHGETAASLPPSG